MTRATQAWKKYQNETARWSAPAGRTKDGGFRVPRPWVVITALDVDRLVSEKYVGRLTPHQLNLFRSSLEEASQLIEECLKGGQQSIMLR